MKRKILGALCVYVPIQLLFIILGCWFIAPVATIFYVLIFLGIGLIME